MIIRIIALIVSVDIIKEAIGEHDMAGIIVGATVVGLILLSFLARLASKALPTVVGLAALKYLRKG